MARLGDGRAAVPVTPLVPMTLAEVLRSGTLPRGGLPTPILYADGVTDRGRVAFPADGGFSLTCLMSGVKLYADNTMPRRLNYRVARLSPTPLWRGLLFLLVLSPAALAFVPALSFVLALALAFGSSKGPGGRRVLRSCALDARVVAQAL